MDRMKKQVADLNMGQGWKKLGPGQGMGIAHMQREKKSRPSGWLARFGRPFGFTGAGFEDKDFSGDSESVALR